MNVGAALGACCREVFLWGPDGEAAFDGYSRQPVTWMPQEDGCLQGAPVEWIVAGPGGPAIHGWGVMVEGERSSLRLTTTFGEAYTPAAGDVIEVVPRIDVEVVAGPESVR